MSHRGGFLIETAIRTACETKTKPRVTESKDSLMVSAARPIQARIASSASSRPRRKSATMARTAVRYATTTNSRKQRDLFVFSVSLGSSDKRYGNRMHDEKSSTKPAAISP
ncbi:hypothetical protein MUP05_06100 [Candidatus Bathyarchaeota archaeon]|jgi:hypothetical protein|nr:hypothetical protein [Candidatus Bathyarchaeota archaeon]